MRKTHPPFLVSHSMLWLFLPAVCACAAPAPADDDPSIPQERIYSPAEIARAIGDPTTLSIHLHDVSPREVFAQVKAQSGVNFAQNFQDRPKVSVDCDAEPFWMGMASLLRQSGYTSQGGDANSYWLEALTPTQPMPQFLSGPHLAVGPFVVELRNGWITKSRSISFEQQDPPAVPGTASQSGTGLQIVTQVLCDPKLQMLQARATVATAIDDTGQSLVDNSRDGQSSIIMSPGQAQPYLYLKAPALGARLVKTLAGSLRLRVITHTQKWQILDPGNGGTVTRHFGTADAGAPGSADLTVAVNGKRNDVDKDTIDLTLAVVEKHRDPFLFAQAMVNGIRWLDAGGKPVDYVLSGSNGEGDSDSATFRPSYRLAHPEVPVAQPLSLVLAVPTDIRDVDVPFAFSDLPLPAVYVPLAARALPVVSQPPPPAPERIYTPEEIARDMGGPTVITLHLHDIPPQQVFDALAADSDIRFIVQGGGDNVSADCDRQSFWPALQMINQQTGYSIAGIAGIAGYILSPTAHTSGARKLLSAPNVTSGPFIIELPGYTLFRHLQWEQPMAPENPRANLADTNLHLQIETHVICDPKLQILTAQASVATATDDVGESLKPAGSSGTSAWFSTPHDASPYLLLKAPAPSAKQLTTLSGNTRLRVVTHTEKWEIPDPLKVGVVTKSFGPPYKRSKFTLHAENKAGEVALDVSLTIEGTNDDAPMFGQLMLATLRWFDALGQQVDCSSMLSSSQNQSGIAHLTATCRFAHPDAPVAEPITLVVNIPTEIRTVDLPFAFANLPLPK